MSSSYLQGWSLTLGAARTKADDSPPKHPLDGQTRLIEYYPKEKTPLILRSSFVQPYAEEPRWELTLLETEGLNDGLILYASYSLHEISEERLADFVKCLKRGEITFHAGVDEKYPGFIGTLIFELDGYILTMLHVKEFEEKKQYSKTALFNMVVEALDDKAKLQREALLREMFGDQHRNKHSYSNKARDYAKDLYVDSRTGLTQEIKYHATSLKILGHYISFHSIFTNPQGRESALDRVLDELRKSKIARETLAQVDLPQKHPHSLQTTEETLSESCSGSSTTSSPVTPRAQTLEEFKVFESTVRGEKVVDLVYRELGRGAQSFTPRFVGLSINAKSMPDAKTQDRPAKESTV